jgi:hypothetical protein
MAIPKYYQETADEKWRDWTHGNVDGRSLKKRDPVAVTVNGITVHALAFDSGEEWDCAQGWRPEKKPEPPPTPENDTKAAGITMPPSMDPDKRPFYEESKTDSGLVVISEAERMKELREKAQEYALRVWSGQSVNVGRSDRIARVKRALEGQGLPFDGVRLPGDAAEDDDDDDEPVTWRMNLPKPQGIV